MIASPALMHGISFGFRAIAFFYYGGFFLFGLLLMLVDYSGLEILTLAGYAFMALIPHSWLKCSRVLFWVYFCVVCFPVVRGIGLVLTMGSMDPVYLGQFMLGLMITSIGDLLLPLSLAASWLAWRYEREGKVTDDVEVVTPGSV